MTERCVRAVRWPWALAALCLAAAVPSGDGPCANTRNVGVQADLPVPQPVWSGSPPPSRARTELVEFETAPFPYNGKVPGQDKAFIDVEDGGRRGHRTPRGHIYWEDQTFSDPRVLLHIPKGFDARRPSLMIIFFHGHRAT